MVLPVACGALLWLSETGLSPKTLMSRCSYVQFKLHMVTQVSRVLYLKTSQSLCAQDPTKFLSLSDVAQIHGDRPESQPGASAQHGRWYVHQYLTELLVCSRSV